MDDIRCADDLRQAVRALDARLHNVLIGETIDDALFDDVIELATRSMHWTLWSVTFINELYEMAEQMAGDEAWLADWAAAEAEAVAKAAS
ncbi:MAG: hypothetical protein LBG60_16790 [Bifidobacteriaceae bacterium]|jgi:hypothetical protein|nr:hypothetical protein [Bifidobacteriaceae bacterium]